VDGVAAFDGRIASGESRWTFPLPATGAAHALSIASTTFVPGTSPSEDRRRLGVAVRSVRVLDANAPLLRDESPSRDFRSRILLRPLLEAVTETGGSTISYRIDVDNAGTATWPTAEHVSAGATHVALGTFWTRAGSTRRLFERRIALPYALAPGEHWTTRTDIHLDVPDMRTLVPGEYALHVGLVLEGAAWFVDRGDAPVSVPITMPRR